MNTSPQVVFELDREATFLTLRRGSTYIAEVSSTQWELCVPAFGNGYCIVRMIPCRPLDNTTRQLEFTEGPENLAVFIAPKKDQ